MYGYVKPIQANVLPNSIYPVTSQNVTTMVTTLLPILTAVVTTKLTTVTLKETRQQSVVTERKLWQQEYLSTQAALLTVPKRRPVTKPWLVTPEPVTSYSKRLPVTNNRLITRYWDYLRYSTQAVPFTYTTSVIPHRKVVRPSVTPLKSVTLHGEMLHNSATLHSRTPFQSVTMPVRINRGRFATRPVTWTPEKISGVTSAYVPYFIPQKLDSYHGNTSNNVLQQVRKTNTSTTAVSEKLIDNLHYGIQISTAVAVTICMLVVTAMVVYVVRYKVKPMRIIMPRGVYQQATVEKQEDVDHYQFMRNKSRVKTTVDRLLCTRNKVCILICYLLLSN